MSAELTVIWWRDIPAQVVAKDDAGSHRVVLSDRFQEAVDRAAVRARLVGTNEYLDQWRRVGRACGDDLAAEAAAETARLESSYPDARLQALAAAGGAEAEA
jgi:hypothetical protein